MCFNRDVDMLLGNLLLLPFSGLGSKRKIVMTKRNKDEANTSNTICMYPSTLTASSTESLKERKLPSTKDNIIVENEEYLAHLGLNHVFIEPSINTHLE